MVLCVCVCGGGVQINIIWGNKAQCRSNHGNYTDDVLDKLVTATSTSYQKIIHLSRGQKNKKEEKSLHCAEGVSRTDVDFPPPPPPPPKRVSLVLAPTAHRNLLSVLPTFFMDFIKLSNPERVKKRAGISLAQPVSSDPYDPPLWRLRRRNNNYEKTRDMVFFFVTSRNGVSRHCVSGFRL